MLNRIIGALKLPLGLLNLSEQAVQKAQQTGRLAGLRDHVAQTLKYAGHDVQASGEDLLVRPKIGTNGDRVSQHVGMGLSSHVHTTNHVDYGDGVHTVAGHRDLSVEEDREAGTTRSMSHKVVVDLSGQNGLHRVSFES